MPCENARKEITTNLTKEQEQSVKQGGSVTIDLNGTECIVVRKDIFDRIRAVVPDDLPTIEEQRQLLRHTGEMAGWDDPKMDV